MHPSQTCFLSVPHRKPRLDPKVSRKQGSDCLTAAAVFNHNSVPYVLAIISISIKQRKNNRQIPPPSGWVLEKDEPMREKNPLLRWVGSWRAGWGSGQALGRWWDTEWVVQGEPHTSCLFYCPSGMNHPNWEPPADNLRSFHEGSLMPPLSLVTSPMRAEHLPNLSEMRDTGSQCHHLPLPIFVHIIPSMNPFSYCERSMGRPSM